MQKILELKYGSHLYGTATENSDLDIKGIFIPTSEQLADPKSPRTIQAKRPKAHGEKNTKDDVDFELLSLPRFLELLCEGQTMALDMLFAPKTQLTYENPELMWVWDEIYANKERLISKNVTAFVGYARKQASKYGIKGSRLAAVRCTLQLLSTFPPNAKLHEFHDELDMLVLRMKDHVSMEKDPLVEIVSIPTHKDSPVGMRHLHVCGRKVMYNCKVKEAVSIYQRVFDEYGQRALQAESNQGVDWKALSHAVRVNSEAIELLNTGKITLPLPNAELILAIKKGHMEYKEVASMIENGLKDLLNAQKVSKLNAEPDHLWVANFLNSVYSKVNR